MGESVIRGSMRPTSIVVGIAGAAVALSVFFASPAMASTTESASLNAGTFGSMSAQMRTGELAAGHVTTESDEADPTSLLMGPCHYMHGSRCVSWVTDYYSCKNIFLITNDRAKHAACAVFVTQGIVTVWP